MAAEEYARYPRGVGRRLKAARMLAGGVTVKQLAHVLNMPRLGDGPLGEIERGARPIYDHEYPRLAEALGIPESFLRDGPADVASTPPDAIAERLAALEQLLREHMDDTRQAVEDIERIAADAQLLDAIRQAAQALGARAPADGEPGADLPKPGDERSQA